jgi:hypothetical protein
VFKKKDGTEVDEATESPKPKLTDAAYEDSWYRSLKAMAATHGEGVEGVEGAEGVEGVEGAEGVDEEEDDKAGSEA